MARTGLYKSQVKKARDSLLLNNRHPSVDAVRIELGNTGSKTTIHKYLKELEGEDGGAKGLQITLSDELKNMVSLLALQLQEEANQELVEVRAAGVVALEKHMESMVALHNELDQVKKELLLAQTSVADEHQAHEQTRLILQNEVICRHTLTQEVHDLKERLTESDAYRQSLEEKHQHARDALVHYRESVKEQREQEQRRYEQHIQQLQAELRLVQQTVIVKQDEVTRLSQDKTRLLTELQHSQEGLDQEHMNHLNTIEQLQASKQLNLQMEVLKAQIVDKDALMLTAHNRLDEEKKNVYLLNEQLRELQLEIVATHAKLEAQLNIADEVRRFMQVKKDV